VAYEAGQAPKPNYRTPGGAVKPIEPSAPEVKYVRKVITPEIWRTRPMRLDRYYRPYFGYPVVVYNDPYNSWFWYWLLAQSLNSQANWAYHHRYTMDQRRYDDLLSRNAELAARVKQLEQSNTARDTSYTPAGLDPDLMYSDDYVDAAYNPREVQADWPSTSDAGVPTSGGAVRSNVRRTWRTLWQGLFAIVATLAISFFLIWLVFIKRWGGAGPVASAAGNPTGSTRPRERAHLFRKRRR
jgi:hypothetical protein